MEREIKTRVSEVWSTIYPNRPAPRNMVLLKLQGRDASNGCIIMLVIDGDTRKPALLVKIPRNPSFTKQIDREWASIDYLAGLAADENVRRHMPAGAVQATVAGKRVLIEGACQGHPMVREFLGRDAVEAMYGPVLEWMYKMHTAAAGSVVAVTGDILEECVSPLCLRLEEDFPDLYSNLGGAAKSYYQSLPEKLNGMKVRMVHQHGDFNAYNLLVEMRGGRLDNFNVIDWEDFSKSSLPIYDLNHFFVCNANLLDPESGTDAKFEKYIVSAGWYQDLYVNAAARYADKLGVDIDAYWALTPLYFIGMAMNVGSEGRQQGETAMRWITWANSFIERFPKIVK